MPLVGVIHHPWKLRGLAPQRPQNDALGTFLVLNFWCMFCSNVLTICRIPRCIHLSPSIKEEHVLQDLAGWLIPKVYWCQQILEAEFFSLAAWASENVKNCSEGKFFFLKWSLGRWDSVNCSWDGRVTKFARLTTKIHRNLSTNATMAGTGGPCLFTCRFCPFLLL